MTPTRADLARQIAPLVKKLTDAIAAAMERSIAELVARADVEREHYLAELVERELAGEQEEPDADAEEERPRGRKAARKELPDAGGRGRAVRTGRARAERGDRDRAVASAPAADPKPAPKAARAKLIENAAKKPAAGVGRGHGVSTCGKCGQRGHNARTCGKKSTASIAAEDEEAVRAVDVEPPPPITARPSPSSEASSSPRRPLEANQPPPGWTPELDRQEELAELSWMTLARTLSIARPLPRRHVAGASRRP